MSGDSETPEMQGALSSLASSSQSLCTSEYSLQYSGLDIQLPETTLFTLLYEELHNHVNVFI